MVKQKTADHIRSNYNYWQLIPFDERDTAMKTQAWTNPQVPVMGFYKHMVVVGFVFQHIGKGEECNNRAAVRRATQLNSERFKLPVIPAFVRV